MILTKNFSFHGATLEAIRDGEDLWVSVRRVCEALDVDESSQRKKLVDAPWAVTVIKTATGLDGKKYKTFCVHVDALPLWLATIDHGRVKENVRPKLAAFQKECAKALKKHFFGGPTGDTEDIQHIANRVLRMQAYKDGKIMWGPEIIRSLCKTFRIKLMPNGGSPPAMSGVYEWIYRCVFGDKFYAEMKRRNPPASKKSERDMHYEWFKEDLRLLMERDLEIVKAISDISVNKHDFKARMLSIYRRDALQLNLLGAA